MAFAGNCTAKSVAASKHCPVLWVRDGIYSFIVVNLSFSK